MDINIKIESNRRSLTIDNKPLEFSEGSAIKANAETIETYCPCQLLYFSSIHAEFSEDYCNLIKTNSLFEVKYVSFTWDGHNLVTAHLGISTPQKYADRDLEYQLALREVIKCENFELKALESCSGQYLINIISVEIQGRSYKEIYLKLNKIIERLHKATIKSLGWK